MNILKCVIFHFGQEKSFRVTKTLTQNIGSSKDERNEIMVAKVCPCSHVFIHILQIIEFIITDLTQKSVFRMFHFFILK